MLAGVLLTAIGFGVIAAIAALTISGSFWAALAAYSLTGMAILLLAGASAGFRGNRPPHPEFASARLAAASRS
ncbi:hypothetical protein [Tabrizicola sp. M-4]|uniref:hypothetical protein n=1 Tax=Tabrizicola sp. M-4 TaxID=3055847 RepID=UPI003DA96D94